MTTQNRWIFWTQTSQEGTYEVKIHRNDAITNVQNKLSSCHDEKVNYNEKYLVE